METLTDLLERSASEHGERTALTIRAGLRDDRWSYRRLIDAADALAAHLTDDLGLEPGARVVVWGPSCPEWAVAFFGALRGRLVVVPLDPSATPALLDRVLDRTEARLLVSGLGDPGGVPLLTLQDLPLAPGRPPSGHEPRPDDVAEIVFTSGTTGHPKGVVLTQRNIRANVASAQAALRPTRDVRLLSVLPLSHMFEQTAGLLLPLCVGASVHYATSRQAPVVVRTMRRHRVTAMACVPQVLELLLHGIERDVDRRGGRQRWHAAHRAAEHLPTSARRLLFRPILRELGGELELLVSGGAALDADVAEAWERMGVTVLEGYGVTECSPSIASNTRTARRPGTVGRPVPGVEIRIGAQDEILVRGANVTDGYWRDAEATRAAFTDDGWYRTGDIGELDGDGFLRLRGRLRDMIVLPSGLNVFPEDVEAELFREPAVGDCAVVGLADRGGPVHVHAVVVAAHGGPEADVPVAEAVRSANRRLAPHQRVTGWTLWEHGDLPRTSLLKVKRHEVLAALTGLPAAEPVTRPAPGPGTDRQDRLLALLAAHAPAGVRVGPKTDLALDLGLDSLGRVELAVRLEEELGLAVEDGDIAAAATVADLSRLVVEGEARSAALVFPEWALRCPARAVRAVLQSGLLFPVHAAICSPFRVEGREHLEGLELPVLLVANHSSHLDTPSVLRALPRDLRRHVAVAAAADYFFSTRPRALAAALLLNAFPFSRAGAVRSSLEHCGELADGGWSVLVYPEGTRSPTGRLQPFRAGTGLLAADLGVPVVPIGVQGAHALLPKGARRPRRGPVTVRFGTPLRRRPGETSDQTAARLGAAVGGLLASVQRVA